MFALFIGLPNGLELSCLAEAGRLRLVVTHASGPGTLPYPPARRVSFSELLCGSIPAQVPGPIDDEHDDGSKADGKCEDVRKPDLVSDGENGYDGEEGQGHVEGEPLSAAQKDDEASQSGRSAYCETGEHPPGGASGKWRGEEPKTREECE